MICKNGERLKVRGLPEINLRRRTMEWKERFDSDTAEFHQDPWHPPTPQPVVTIRQRNGNLPPDGHPGSYGRRLAVVACFGLIRGLTERPRASRSRARSLCASAFEWPSQNASRCGSMAEPYRFRGGQLRLAWFPSLGQPAPASYPHRRALIRADARTNSASSAS